MLQTPWNLHHIKQCEQLTGQAMLLDEHSLALFSEDFGHLAQVAPCAVFIAKTIDQLQIVLHYAYQHQLPITIRGNGLSQGGQARALAGGVIVHIEKSNQPAVFDGDSIWINASNSWSDLLTVSLTQQRMPFVLPYNCQLSIGGVLSAGGVGASSFKYGSVISHVNALDIITAEGHQQICTAESPLFQACLGGQGQFGVITRARIALRPCAKKVRTFFLTYIDKQSWLDDLDVIKPFADSLELFCSPSIQGAKLSAKGRLPFAEWLFAMHVMVEYDEQAPELPNTMSPWKLAHCQDESITSWAHRHDSRFGAMKMTGQWDLPHPWYECFISKYQLSAHLDELLTVLPIYYATVLQVVPICNKKPTGFFMMPESQEVFALMILNAGLPSVLIPGCLDVIAALDKRFLTQGGKRYLSGYLGTNITNDYWQQHFAHRYIDWLSLKEQYDPHRIFCSDLFKAFL